MIRKQEKYIYGLTLRNESLTPKAKEEAWMPTSPYIIEVSVLVNRQDNKEPSRRKEMSQAEGADFQESVNQDDFSPLT
jgi:hypothetical protein